MRKYSILFLVLVLLVPLVVLAGCAPAEPELGTEGNPIIIAWVPSAEAERVIASSEELANLLAEKTGYVFEGVVPTSYSAAIEAMCTGKAHMGTLATFSYILAHEKCGVDVALVAVRYGAPYYTGQIIAGADTGITKVEDLAGKTVCWVDAASTSGYIIPRIWLKSVGVDPDTDLAQQVETGSHDNVALAVYQGDCDAGATYVDARDAIADEYPDVYDKTIVVGVSAPIPNDGLQFIKDFPADMREEIVNAVLEIMETDEGVEAMGLAYGWDAVEVQGDSFYDDFRAVLDASGVDIEELAD